MMYNFANLYGVHYLFVLFYHFLLSLAKNKVKDKDTEWYSIALTE